MIQETLQNASDDASQNLELICQEAGYCKEKVLLKETKKSEKTTEKANKSKNESPLNKLCQIPAGLFDEIDDIVDAEYEQFINRTDSYIRENEDLQSKDDIAAWILDNASNVYDRFAK